MEYYITKYNKIYCGLNLRSLPILKKTRRKDMSNNTYPAGNILN